GITETCVHVTEHILTPADRDAQDSPIGRPIPSLTTYLLDAALRPVPPGAPGEIYVAGHGLARGYQGRPDLTADRFLPDPFSATPGARMYRSGDRARQNTDGSLTYLGRIDHQIQLRGHRIELGEIEATLAALPGVAGAIVRPHQPDPDAPDDIRLAAWIVDAPPEDDAEAATRIAQWQSVYDITYGGSSPIAGSSAGGSSPTAGSSAGGSSPDGSSPTGSALPTSPPAPPSKMANDLALDITGWHSSFTGQPIPAAEMREWRDATCARIRTLLPDPATTARVMEVGCGTGMILFDIAPDVAAYHAVDLSPHIIDRLKSQTADAGLAHVTLAAAAAHEATATLAPTDRFDLIILNSVVQYFPSMTYLRAAITALAAHLAPGGRIFLGDLRDQGRLPAFHAHLAALTATPEEPRAAFAHRALTREAEEEELTLAPGALAGIAGLTARPCLKRGHAETEMQLYRYDLLLSDQPGRTLPHRDLSGLTTLPAHLTATEPMLLTGLTDPRLSPHQTRADWIALSAATAAEGERVSDAPLPPNDLACTPEDAIAWAEAIGLQAAALPDPDAPARFRLLISPEPIRTTDLPTASATPRAHNAPLRATARLALRSALHAAADAALPAHMRPNSYTFLTAMPLSPSGKLVTKSLPNPAQITAAKSITPPQSATERRLLDAFQKTLKTNTISTTDNFFHIGGNSLNALTLIQNIQKSTNHNITLKSLFQYNSIQTIAHMI
ncbi:acyl-CoA synthetase (AMP-forming)/AMP-acid ligase II/acyl carrier protein, partial [Rubricella aquisinus]